jgi:hypothetical protein
MNDSRLSFASPIFLAVYILLVVHENFRLFLSRPSGKQDGSLRSVRRASNLSVYRAVTDQTTTGVGRNGSVTALGTDQQHPGPIFLRHVVTRRFQYRWLILALSAISCMAVVVVVSVIYSNR